MFEFTLFAKDRKNKARVGEFLTPHGKLQTPELAFVATEGEIKSIPREILPTLPARLIIVNTFHLWAKEILCQLHLLHLRGVTRPNRTIHDYANFRKPIMSDSGGFQVFSMGFGKAHGIGKVASMFPGKNKNWLNGKSKEEIESDFNNPLKISEKGVEFTFNGEKIHLTPEKSMEIQKKIGADIMFAFDECTSPLNSYVYTKKAMERTHRWLVRCLNENRNLLRRNSKIVVEKREEKRENNNSPVSNFHNQSPISRSQFPTSDTPQALFAIVQGGYFKDLRKISATYVGKQDVPGFGIGGSLGTTEEEVRDVLEWTIPYLPEEKPRHLLGIGKVRDIFDGVEQGVDLFDCVIPTREARHKVIYTKRGKINVRKYKTVDEVVDKHCACQMCQEKITLYKLYELYKLDKLKAFYYATVHNIQFFALLMKEIREAIVKNRFLKLKESYLQYY